MGEIIIKNEQNWEIGTDTIYIPQNQHISFKETIYFLIFPGSTDMLK